jgi:hypothetical protein
MPGFNFVPPVRQLTPEQLAQLGLAAFRPPNPMSMPGMPSAPTGGGAQQDMSIGQGMGMLAAGLGALKGVGDPGAAAQSAAIAADPTVQANPATSAAGMLAGTNPDVGIGGGMQAPPDGSTGVGTSPYAGGGPMAWLRRQLGLVDPLTRR